MTDEGGEGRLPLGGTRRDLAVSGLKGLVGAIPMAGPMIAEIVSNLIPNQRIQRLEAYVLALGAQLAAAGEDFDPATMAEPKRIDLFEDGALQAARALSDQRIEHIAHLVAHGLSGGDTERMEAKRLLNLLGQIDDDQVVILAAFLRKNRSDREFLTRHKDLLTPPMPTLASGQDLRDKETLFTLTRNQLRDLGLLETRFRRPPRDGEPPILDPKTGMLVASGLELAPAGRMLLIRLGLAAPGDR